MEIIPSILTNHRCYKTGTKMTVRGLMLHSVGCPQPSAKVFVKQWNVAKEGLPCVHAFIDGHTGKVYQTLPWNHRAWHCGGNANGTHIGVEMCEPSCIQYTRGSTFNCSSQAAALEVAKRTYDSSVELFAYLCKQYGLDPLKDGVIISHKEGHDRGVASGHGDPEHLWKGLGTGYTMDDFRKAVAAAMGAAVAVPEDKKEWEASQSIAIGDVVKLQPDAVYYKGKEIPQWVKKDVWKVKSIDADRVVIDQNVAGTCSICSPVNIKYLNVVSPAPRCLDSQTGDMQISDRGISLVAKYEGCRLKAYKCPAGVWTIGYGHTKGVKPEDTLESEAAAKKLLEEDLRRYGNFVNQCAKSGRITFVLNQNQFDALTSFTYNCGAGSLRTLISGRSAQEVATMLLAYNRGGGRVLAGLVKRRKEEQQLFLS